MGLLRAQPMGFYSPQSLVADARRHGVLVREPDLNAGLAHATLEPEPDSTGGVAIRLGLAGVRTVGETVADAIAAERQAHGRYTSIGDLTRRIQLTKTAVEALATAAATTRLGHLPGLDAPALPGMTRFEVTAAGRIQQCRPRIRTRLGRCCEREDARCSEQHAPAVTPDSTIRILSEQHWTVISRNLGKTEVEFFEGQPDAAVDEIGG
ncbi:hypothetical protein [Amycolatopsis sp. cmx-8-4]|uniref:helix-hairpin-helix domain-containing protein n=1 Tax=Amycolatopsis sp. cmx-8-4 TaxID=2790947 RepID=UPI003978B05F